MKDTQWVLREQTKHNITFYIRSLGFQRRDFIYIKNYFPLKGNTESLISYRQEYINHVQECINGLPEQYELKKKHYNPTTGFWSHYYERVFVPQPPPILPAQPIKKVA